MKRTLALIFGGLLAAILLVAAPALVRAATVQTVSATPAALQAAEQLYSRGELSPDGGAGAY